MRHQDLDDWLDAEPVPNPGWKTFYHVKTVDEDGFVRDIVKVTFDQEAECYVLHLEIQKKNGEIE